MRVPCWDGDILYLNCSVNILVVILYYSWIVCYHWEGLGKTIHKIYFFFLQLQVNLVHLPSHVQLFVIPWTVALQASLSLTISQSLPKFMSIASVIPSSHLILWWDAIQPSHPLMHVNLQLSKRILKRWHPGFGPWPTFSDPWYRTLTYAQKPL